MTQPAITVAEVSALISWVEEYPTTKGARGYQDLVKEIAKDYELTSDSIDLALTSFRDSMARGIGAKMSMHSEKVKIGVEAGMPSAEMVQKWVDAGIQAALLRTALFMLELSQRYLAHNYVEKNQVDVDSFLEKLNLEEGDE